MLTNNHKVNKFAHDVVQEVKFGLTTGLIRNYLY